MNTEKLSKTAETAKEKLNSQKLRHISNFLSTSRPEIEDPDEEELSDDGQEDIGLDLSKFLPNLRSLPESFVKKLPVSVLFQLNAALAKEQKNVAKLGINSRLAQNAQSVADKPAKIAAGIDNRKDILHQARFLGGASCSNTDFWLAAKKSLGKNEIVALGNYDLDSVGCGGSVTPKGWKEIHNPASQELKLKLFHLPNVANSSMTAKKVNLDGESESLSIGDSMKEIVDLDGFKVALNTAREAMHSALPWNRSVCSLVGFMLNTNYLQEDMGGNNRRAALLTEFADYVLGRNALNWENGQPFLTTDDLAHVWSNWKGKRGGLASGKFSEKKTENKNEKKKERPDNGICRRYNAGDCVDQTAKECKTPWGKVLKHACNKFMPGGKVCGKEHPRNAH